ncbi:unnamed protein product [Didymodactylos carnosus]|uniref:TATA box-binding protein-like 1 n=1 Tax=Didymodactylos carnosus TaxID=1234261 RepID=A0A814BV20_9BILA|nr:unnamed protein product [Didymodactylos carnosus]CAF0933905.1 unnamed protein product [Didymodactylos carnosus]CAF3669625.1 unnamed protein product [Didymodactylos carnosus]CAF3711475.1 unnamed protein product [Didymodactylos carnosus]
MSYPSGQIYTVYNPTSSSPVSSNIITAQTSPTVMSQQQTGHLSFIQTPATHYYQPSSQTYLSQQPTNSNLLANTLQQQPQQRLCRPLSSPGFQIINSSASSTLPMFSNINIIPNSTINNQPWRVSNPQIVTKSQLSSTTPVSTIQPQNKIVYINTLPSSQSSNNIHMTNILQPCKIISSPSIQTVSTVKTSISPPITSIMRHTSAPLLSSLNNVNILNQTDSSISQQLTPRGIGVTSPLVLSTISPSFSSSKVGHCITPTPIVTGNVGALTIQQQTLYSMQQQQNNLQKLNSVNNFEHVMHNKSVNNEIQIDKEDVEEENSDDESDLEEDIDDEEMKEATSHQHQTDTQNQLFVHSTVDSNDDVFSPQQDQEIELNINNVVCSFSLGCKIQLRKVAMEGAHVEYKRDNAMVMMKIRNPYCSANIWASGKVTVTGATSEDDALRGSRRVARRIQQLGFKAKFCNYRVVNVLATCLMPFNIDITKLSHDNSYCVSYEPEIYPGATVRLKEFSSTMKVFTTGSITLTAPSVENVNLALNAFYPRLYECQKGSNASKQAERRNQHR